MATWGPYNRLHPIYPFILFVQDPGAVRELVPSGGRTIERIHPVRRGPKLGAISPGHNCSRKQQCGGFRLDKQGQVAGGWRDMCHILAGGMSLPSGMECWHQPPERRLEQRRPTLKRTTALAFLFSIRDFCHLSNIHRKHSVNADYHKACRFRDRRSSRRVRIVCSIGLACGRGFVVNPNLHQSFPSKVISIPSISLDKGEMEEMLGNRAIPFHQFGICSLRQDSRLYIMIKNRNSAVNTNVDM
ncbi:hypothetical protein BDZ91DRAFT_831544 [Kalaharituber pfeilii]|nr:hypothetical protein BDZ91DRAFT_831544 [Kalaharituber pfeilii]